MTYHQASVRFLLDRIPLIDRRRSHLVAYLDDADDERSDEREGELASEVTSGKVSLPRSRRRVMRRLTS